MKSVEISKLTKMCLEKLTSAGVLVLNTCCDGPKANRKALEILGACLNSDEIDSTLTNIQVEQVEPVQGMLDNPHMVKNIR